MNILVKKDDKTPVYLQISLQIRKRIIDGTLVDGYALPSERNLAAELGVHRNTVTRAYSELKEEGLISAYQGKGYRVSFQRIYGEKAGHKHVNWESLMRDEYAVFESDFDSIYSKSFNSGLISFGGGVAAREPYPPEETADTFEQILKCDRGKAYFYTPYQGDEELRKEIAAFMMRKGITTNPGNIQVFTGNNQAFDFILNMMLSPGDKILVQETMSPDVFRTIRLAGGEVVTVPMDESGMITDSLEALIEKEAPKFIYVDSSFNNPTGTLVTIERKQKLLELSYSYRIPIIEEDEGSELYYEAGSVQSIKSMDPGNNVIYMYSFSLTMTPGIGISFVIADNIIIERFSDMVSLHIASPDWAGQMVTLEYMKNGTFDSRLEVFRKVCRDKRNLMLRHLDDMKELTGIEYEVPRGGVYFWIKLPEELNARDILKHAQKGGVIFMPGHVFYSEKNLGRDRFRLNFSYPSMEEIDKGMKILKDVLLKRKLAHKKTP